MLIADENLVNVVGMSWTAGKLIPQHLKHVFDTGGIIDVDIRDAVTRCIHKEGQLQVPVMIGRLEASCM